MGVSYNEFTEKQEGRYGGMIWLKAFTIIILIAVFVFIRVKKQLVKIKIISGKGVGQVRYVIGYDAKTKTIKINKPFAVSPDKTSKYVRYR